MPSISTESFGSDSISVNGQDPRNNNYTVDGGNNNDDVIGQRAGMQARTPIEAVQEFQVITGQYDAEFGRTTGAVVNAVIKSGTNVVHGSAFGYFQDSSLTTKDFFATQRNLAKADTSYQRWGGDIGGPIVKDQHALLRQPRAVRDRPRQHHRHPDASRPERSADDPGPRLEHHRPRRPPALAQPHLQRALAARAVAADEPDHPDGRRQHVTVPTGRAAREESDVDQTVAFNLNSVLSNTKVNTLRVTWTRENVAFANACFNANDRDLGACQPTLAYQNFIDQQDNTGQSRINDGIAIDDTLAWFLPGKRGDHDIKVGLQYVVLGAQNENQGNLNGTFSFGQNDADFDPANSAHLSGSPHHPRRRPQPVLPEGDRTSPLRAGQVAHDAAAHAEPRPALRPRGHSAHRDATTRSSTDTRSTRTTSQPRLGVTYDLGGGRSVVRAATAASTTRRTSS